MNNLLISEQPLVVIPTLAKKLNSVDKAIMLQQIHYWLLKSGNEKDGKKWVYNTVHDWAKQFPWLTEKTVQRYLKNLEDMGLLVTANYNKAKFDRTKWYSIDYDALEKLGQEDDSQEESGNSEKSDDNDNQSHQNAEDNLGSREDKVSKAKDNLGEAKGLSVPTKGTVSTNPKGLPGVTYTRDYTETTTENNNNKKINKKSDPVPRTEPPYSQIIGYLNHKTNAHYKPSSSANQKLINARWSEGYRFEDFKKVIDNQAFVWQGTRFWKYMRPSTLFRVSKFDEYLNANNLDQQKGEPNNAGFDQLPGSDGGIPDIPDDDLPF